MAEMHEPFTLVYKSARRSVHFLLGRRDSSNDDLVMDKSIALTEHMSRQRKLSTLFRTDLLDYG